LSGFWHDFTQASVEIDFKQWKMGETCKIKHYQDLEHNLNGGNVKERRITEQNERKQQPKHKNSAGK